MPYKIEFSAGVEGHLRALTVRQRAIVLDEIKKQLTHEPKVETRNRKRMRPNVVAPWELRIREMRIYYDIADAKQVVIILAVGIKERNQVRIGKEIVEL